MQKYWNWYKCESTNDSIIIIIHTGPKPTEADWKNIHCSHYFITLGMFSKLPVTQRPIIGCCNSMLRSKTCISTSIVVNMSNSPLTQFTNQQESKFSKSTLTMLKRVAKKTARRMSHKYSSSTFSGGCGTARNSKEFLSFDIARDSEYHNIWYIITYNCNI